MGIITLIRKVIERIFIGKPVIIDGKKYYVIETELDKVHNRGIRYYERKRYKKAIECFEKEIELDPEGNMGYEYKGLTLMELGRKEEGIKYLEKALEKARDYYKKDGGETMDKEVLDELEEELSEAGRDADTT